MGKMDQFKLTNTQDQAATTPVQQSAATVPAAASGASGRMSQFKTADTPTGTGILTRMAEKPAPIPPEKSWWNPQIETPMAQSVLTNPSATPFILLLEKALSKADIAKDTANLLKESVVGGLQAFNPVKTWESAKELVKPLAGETGFGATKMAEETEAANIGLADAIMASFKRGSITNEKARELLNGLPETEVSGNESKIDAFLKGGLLALDVAAKYEIVKTAAGAAKQVVKNKLVKSVTPALTKAEKILAAEQGRVTQPGLLREAEVKPPKETIKSVEGLIEKGVLKPLGNLNTNLSSVNNEIKRVAVDDVAPLMKAHQQGFNMNQIGSTLDDLPKTKPIPFATADGSGFYKRAIKTAKDEIAKQAHNAEGLWKARQAFDDKIDDVIRGAWASPDAGGMKTAVNEVRRAMNEYIVTLLKEDGPAFIEAMKYMSVMYDFRHGLADNIAAKLGENILSQMVEKIPLLKHIKHLFK